MKKIFRIRLAICMALIGISSSPKATAQDLIPSSNPDTSLATVLLVASDLNCAIYDGGAKLFGATWRDGVGTVNFSIRDNSQYVASMPATITPPSMWDSYYGADMVIGAPYSLSTQYFVGIVYSYATNNLPFSGDILMDVYKIEYVFGVPTITGQNLTIPIATGIGMHPSFPHIDLINKQDPNTPSIFYSDKFVISWTTTSGMTPTTEACAGSLIDAYNNGNTNIVYASNTMNDVANVPGGFENQSDITGIERTINAQIKDIAYVVFTDNAGNPYITQWNITDNVVNWNNTPIDASVPAYEPRIDGLDPYTQAGNGDDYCVAWSYNTSGIRQIKSYAPTNGLLTNTVTAYNSIDQISTTSAVYPAVACSPNAQYTTFFYSHGGNAILENMDWYNSFDNNCTCTTSSNQDYFQVNDPNAIPQPLYVANASAWAYNSSSGNLEPSINMVAWSEESAPLTNILAYKRFTTLASNPFKQPNSITTTTNEASLSISPNPAYDKLDIEGIANGTDYTITDVTGRNVQSGKIASAHIHINTLASGMYILNTENQKVKFVKE